MRYYTQLATEAVVVGGVFVPWSLLTDCLLTPAVPDSKWRAPLVAFLSGSTFHLLAEATGLNTYYLHNSAAHLRDVGRWQHRAKIGAKSKKRKCGVVWAGPSLG